MIDLIPKVLDLNRQVFAAGDEYNSESLLRGGIEARNLTLLTLPRRPKAAEPLLAYVVLKQDRRVIRLERIAVSPSARNGGIGREMLRQALKWRSRHRPGVLIWTYISADNPASINAHVHAGFGIEVIGPDWVWVMG